MARRKKPTSKSKHKPNMKGRQPPRLRRKKTVRFLGRQRIIDKDKPSQRLSTQEKAKYLRSITTLPFKATKRFNAKQKEFIDNHYDGLKGHFKLSLIKNFKRFKIKDNEIERYTQAGYVVLPRKYKYRGKTKTGWYVYYKPIAKKSKIRKRKFGFIEEYLDRIDIKINFNQNDLKQFLLNPEDTTAQIIERYIDTINTLGGDYVIKLMYPGGYGGFEFEDIEKLIEYLDVMDDGTRGRISGIALVFHK